ncbi:hypothetical protein ACH4E8_19490 [Streptomyces sp. NPDC017979]|uniref:glutamine amidotransferase-related protein n=1 Tax=Streptomyces sp. NPDC017979 TaxID=3365024 RepID=UPI0037BCFE79
MPQIDPFGASEQVSFYNTFALHGEHDEFVAPGAGPIRVSRDATTGEVHALRGPGFASRQFHPESILTRGGLRILAPGLAGLLTPAGTTVAA